jgi:predicted lipid-binding transport protein (Tim44 family)
MSSMLKTIFMTGLMVILGMIALGLVFSIFGTLIGVTFWLLGFAIKALIVGGVAYLAVRVFAPDTARRLRERWSGTSINRY